jgi:tetratricopeptide (TPR) repeat protein
MSDDAASGLDPLTLRRRADDLLALHEEGRIDDALAVAETLSSDAERSDTTDAIVRETLFTARFERALLLTELGELREAAAAYRYAAATPADDDDPDQRHEIAMALLNGGICLDTGGEHLAALAVYDELVERFGTADDPVTRDQVIRGRVNRAAALLAVGRPGEASEAAQAVADELDPGDALDAEQLTMAVRLRAAALRAMDRTEDAVATLAEVERCTDEDPAARSQVAAAMRERAEALAELGRAEDARSLLGDAIERFAEDPDPAVIEVVEDLTRTQRVLERS